MSIATPPTKEAEMATATTPGHELDEARDRLRHERLDRQFEGEQLTFDTGAGFKAAPDFATLKDKTSGEMTFTERAHTATID